MRESGVRVCLVVDFHQLADGSVRIFLRGGERLVAEQFLNRAEISAIGEQVSGKRVPQRMRMKVPIGIYQAHVFLDDAADGTLREAAAGIIQEDGFRMWSRATARPGAGGSQQELFAKRPVFVER